MIRILFNNLFFVIKRVIFSILLIYAFNLIIFPIGIIIPMNFFTIITVMLCGFPSIIGFSLFLLFVL